MMTTEPSIELKLKKGGTVAHKKMKADASSGHKPMAKMMDGGVLSALQGTPALVRAPMRSVAPVARPARPSLAARRAAMAAGQRRVMKEGGETKAEHKSEKAEIKKVESELKAHEGKKASVAHKGLKKGGKCYAEGGLAKSGIIKSEKGETKMVTAEYTGKSGNKTGDVKLGNGGGYKTGGVVKGNGGGYKTGGVILGNGGGYKKGGATKKAYASGGSVNNEGKATSMPQGNKKPSSPVSINQLSGTFKKGGNVSSKALQANFKKENATAVKQSKAKLMDKYSPYQKAGGGQVSDSEYNAVMRAEKAGKKTMIYPSSDKAFDSAVSSYKSKVQSQKKYPSGLTDSDIDKVLSSKQFQEGASHFSDYKRGGKAKK